MTHEKKLERMVVLNNGIIMSKNLSMFGIPRYAIQKMLKKGKLEKVERGIYLTPETFEDIPFVLQQRFPKIIFSHETALFFNDLTDVTPITWAVTIPRGYPITKSLSEKNFWIRHTTEKAYKMGVIEKNTVYGRKIKVYSAEKTLCDIVRPRSKCEIGMVVAAFQSYVKSELCKPYLVLEYAKKLNVEKIVNQYLQTLL